MRIRVQNLDKAVSLLHNVNSLGEGIDPNILPPDISKL